MIFHFDSIIKKTNLPFSDCDKRTCSFLLPRELSFIGNVQSQNKKGFGQRWRTWRIISITVQNAKNLHPAGSEKSQYHLSRVQLQKYREKNCSIPQYCKPQCPPSRLKYTFLQREQSRSDRDCKCHILQWEGFFFFTLYFISNISIRLSGLSWTKYINFHMHIWNSH